MKNQNENAAPPVESAGGALPPAQILDLARRCGIKATEAALIEFAALVRDARPLSQEEMRPVQVAQPVEAVEASGSAVRVPTCTIRPEIGARGVMGYGVLDESFKLVAVVSVESFKAAAAHPAEPVIPAPRPTDESRFKNFHRSLCARFGYTHDEQYWWRDLVSLEEHIAAHIARQAQPTDAQSKDVEWLTQAAEEAKTCPEIASKIRAAARFSAQARPTDRDAEWTSVDDDLPEVETDVLVRGMRGNSVCHEVAGLFNGEWLGQNSERELRFTVTHWMPLPAIRALKGADSEGAAS